MCTHAVESHESMFQISPLLYAGDKCQLETGTLRTSTIIDIHSAFSRTAS